MEYFIGVLILLFIAGIIIFYKKDIAKAFKKAVYLKKLLVKKAAEYKDTEPEDLSGKNTEKHTACEYDMDILARKIAKAWWKEYNKRMWIKIIFAILIFIIGVNAVDSYMESVISQFKSLLSVFPQ